MHTTCLLSAPLSLAELESVCVEAFYLEQGIMDQRAFAAAFDATFVQVGRSCCSNDFYRLALLGTF